MANSEERLNSILATLSVAILDLRTRLNRIADSDLKALCDAMSPDEAPAERSPEGQRRRPLLKLVK